MKLGKLYEDKLSMQYGCITNCYPELICLQETLRYSLIINVTEYSLTQHKQKDSYIEQWLSGKLRIFENAEIATKILTKEYQDKIDKKRSYVI